MDISPFEDKKEKYRWFYTKSGKLVLGGKSAEQNDLFLKKIISLDEDLLVMHTNSPGSPFSVIFSPVSKVKKSDILETAIFTASFSQQWKQQKKNAKVDLFYSSSLNKTRLLKTGTWLVKEKIDSIKVPLELVLIKQKGKLRAVPLETAKKREILLSIRPGKLDKLRLSIKIQTLLSDDFSKEEVLQALPPGGIRIISKK